MVCPHDKAEYSDGYTGERHERVSKDAFAGKTWNDFADDAHAGQNHNVNSGMRVKPEHMLEQHWVAAQFGIEDSDVETTFQSQQNQGNRDHRRSQNHNETGSKVRPHEKRQSAPGHAGSAHAV